MHRVSLALSLLVVMLLGLATLGRGAVAQDATETAELTLATREGHPLVGSWIVTEPGGTPSIVTFTSDGTATDIETETAAAGGWEATGDDTANVTFVGFFTGESFSVYFVIRASITVGADGDTFEAPYSGTVVDNTGTVLDTVTGTVTGTRMPVEPADEGGSPLDGMPTWTIETGEGGGAATPTTDVTEVVEPTVAPTEAATEEPTVAPTAEPTEEASPAP